MYLKDVQVAGSSSEMVSCVLTRVPLLPHLLSHLRRLVCMTNDGLRHTHQIKQEYEIMASYIMLRELEID